MTGTNNTHIIGIHGPQTDAFVWHAPTLPSGQSDILVNGNKAIQVVDATWETIKNILVTRLDTFRFGDLTEENIIRILRHEIMQDADTPIWVEDLKKINASLTRASNYLTNKWYPPPRNVPKRFATENAMCEWIQNQRKSKDGYVTKNICRYLQVLNAYHTLLCVPGVTIDTDGDVDIRDKELMKRIISIFGDADFKYTSQDNTQFSKESNIAKGSYVPSTWGNWNIPFYARFRLKNEERGVQKFIQNPEYDVKAFLQDMHGMRIEVSEPAHAFKMLEYILQSMKIPTDTLEIKNRDMCSRENWETWSGKWHFSENFMRLINEKAKFWSQTKMASAQRRELKFSCGNPSFEVQVVLVNNQNESGYAHHCIYECMGDIFEKIRFDGYINTVDIDAFIASHIEAESLKDIGMHVDNIRKYILQKLIPIEFPGVKSKKNIYTTLSSVFRMAMADLADIRPCILHFPPHTKDFLANTIYGEYAGKSISVGDLAFTPQLMALIDDENDDTGTARPITHTPSSPPTPVSV